MHFLFCFLFLLNNAIVLADNAFRESQPDNKSSLTVCFYPQSWGEDTIENVDFLNLEMRGEPPAAQNSGNKTILEEYIGIAFVVANSLILLITFAVGIAANIFVILAVYRKKSLQTSNNALVVNLAVIDILRCVVDCPVLLTIIITVYQRGTCKPAAL
uniref:G-protein coupled receptors family 1 profile domain-containing protein n=1 Tax=Sphaeramia orbicularis TaxID=375764 RepID=A0A673CDX5_9TELE